MSISAVPFLGVLLNRLETVFHPDLAITVGGRWRCPGVSGSSVAVNKSISRKNRFAWRSVPHYSPSGQQRQELERLGLTHSQVESWGCVLRSPRNGAIHVQTGSYHSSCPDEEKALQAYSQANPTWAALTETLPGNCRLSELTVTITGVIHVTHMYEENGLSIETMLLVYRKE